MNKLIRIFAITFVILPICDLAIAEPIDPIVTVAVQHWPPWQIGYGSRNIVSGG